MLNQLSETARRPFQSLELFKKIEKSKLKAFDFSIFVILVMTVTLYQIQFLWSGFKDFHIREVLLAYLYLRVLVSYRPKFNKELVIQLLFLGSAFFVALHTLLAFQGSVAIHGFIRYVNVGLLAPLAYVFIDTMEQAKKVFTAWCTIVMAGIGTVAYQLYIATMPWLVRDYIAIRGDLIRHKSLLGEPNVGGFAAVLFYIFAFLLVKNNILRLFLFLITLFLVVVCISKAAALIFVISNFLLLLHALWRKRLGEDESLKKFLTNMLALVFCSCILLSNQSVRNYGKVSWKSLTGEIRGEPTPYRDLNDRFFEQRYGRSFGGGEFQKTFFFLFGGSFAMAGSAAVELKVTDAVAPHNGYLEIFMVGGLVALLLFLYVQWHTLWSLFRKTRNGSVFHWCLFLLFVLLCLNLAGYPTMYEPVNGALFWLIIGIGSKKIKEEQLGDGI